MTDLKNQEKNLTAPAHTSTYGKLHDSQIEDFNSLARLVADRQALHDQDPLATTTTTIPPARAPKDSIPMATPGDHGAAGPAGRPAEHNGFTNRFDEVMHKAADTFSGLFHSIEERFDHMISATTSSAPTDTTDARMRDQRVVVADKVLVPDSSDGSVMEMQPLRTRLLNMLPSPPTQAPVSPATANEPDPPMGDAGTDFSMWQPTSEVPPPGPEPPHESDLPTLDEIEQQGFAPDRPLKQQIEERRAREEAFRVSEGN